jgi:hypothetical protein
MPFVYFIHEEGHIEVFKIGKTEKHPADRCEQLQTGNPRKLIIYRWIEVVDHTAIEGYLHGKYRDVRVRGEWFYITKDQIDVECAIIMGAHAECTAAGLAFLGKNITRGMAGGGGGGRGGGAPEDGRLLADYVKVSDEYPVWTDEDRIRVQEERQRRGKYRGKRNPREVANARNEYFRAMGERAADPAGEKIFTDE